MRLHHIDSVLLERHQDRVVALEQYANDPSIFIHFSNLEKLGINPRLEFDTPVGIYAYPLKEMWDSVRNNTIPFASKRNFVHVFRAEGNIPDVASITRQLFWEASAKLEEKFAHLLPKSNDHSVETPMPWKEWEKRITNNALVHSPGGHLWALVRACALLLKGTRRPPVAWNEIMRWLGFQGVTDRTGSGTIHPNEPCQAVFFDIRAVHLVKTLHNVTKRHRQNDYHSTVEMLSDLTMSMQYYDEEEDEADLKYRAVITRNIANEWVDLLLNGKSRHYTVKDRGAFIDWEEPGEVNDFIRTMFTSYPQSLRSIIEGLKRRPELRGVFDFRWLVKNFVQRSSDGSYLSAMFEPETKELLCQWAAISPDEYEKRVAGQIVKQIPHCYASGSFLTMEGVDLLRKTVGQKVTNIIRRYYPDKLINSSIRAIQDDIEAENIPF